MTISFLRLTGLVAALDKGFAILTPSIPPARSINNAEAIVGFLILKHPNATPAQQFGIPVENSKILNY